MAAVDEKWFTFLTARERAPGQTDPTAIRTDVFVSQFPMAGVALLNRDYDSEAVAAVAVAAHLTPPPVAAPRRKRGRQEPPAVTQDPYNQLRSATRVVDVLTVVEQLDNVRGATASTMTSSAQPISSASTTMPSPSPSATLSLVNGTSSASAAPLATDTTPPNGMATGAPTDVYTLDNMRRESAKPNSGRYHVVAILGPLETRDAAIALGMLWRFNIRNVESRRMRGYLLGLYFRLGYWVDLDIERALAAPPPPPSVSKRRVVEKRT